uniref:Uncharacterized protein n=1 Tax=Aliivibrio phage vB_Alvi_H905 TaxID=3234039 RepID=A0AB39C9U6_9VIRU
MAFSKDDIDALDEAIASGELSVKIDGREITYRSMTELFRAKRHIYRMIAKQNGIKISPFAGSVVRIDRGIR